MKKLITLFSLFLFISCSNETDEKVESNLRANFLKNKTNSEVKSAYNKLKAEDRINLWNEKFDQIKNQNISKDIKKLIINLQLEFKKEHVDFNNIRKIGIELANILPEEQFDDMFIKLEDYNHRQYPSIPISQDIKIKLQNSKMQFEPSSSYLQKGKKLLRDCSCEWTCSSFCPNGTTSNCEPTPSGCGFLWAFECGSSCR